MRHLLATVLPVHLFFNDAATTKIYTLSLHDALPIFLLHGVAAEGGGDEVRVELDDALHDAEVGLVDLPLLELGREALVRVVVLRHEDDAARVPVEAVHDAGPEGPLHEGELPVPVGERVGHRAAPL